MDNVGRVNVGKVGNEGVVCVCSGGLGEVVGSPLPGLPPPWPESTEVVVVVVGSPLPGLPPPWPESTEVVGVVVGSPLPGLTRDVVVVDEVVVGERPPIDHMITPMPFDEEVIWVVGVT